MKAAWLQTQCAKKKPSNSWWLVNFPFGLVVAVLHLQVNCEKIVAEI